MLTTQPAMLAPAGLDDVFCPNDSDPPAKLSKPAPRREPSMTAPGWYAGLMTGTVLDDQIDIALLKTDGDTISEFGPATMIPDADTDRRVIAAAVDVAQNWNFAGAEPAIFADAERALTRAQSRAVDVLPVRIERLFVCGGGRQNPILMQAIAEATGVTTDPAERVGWRSDAVEAECFAYLAARHMAGLPVSHPQTTGVPAPMPAGRLAAPGPSARLAGSGDSA